MDPFGGTAELREMMDNVNARLSEPDYQLLWPRVLFTTEAEKLLDRPDADGWDDRCELLLEDAFVHGYAGGPLSEFREIPAEGLGSFGSSRNNDPRAARASLTFRQIFLRDLIGNARHLREDASHLRPYWSARKGRSRSIAVFDTAATVRAFVELIHELDEAGYFEKRFGKDCVDDPRGEGSFAAAIEQQIGVADLWPLDQNTLVGDSDMLFDTVEVLHDLVSRPLTRYVHPYAGCGYHHGDFEIESGRTVYRWRVNKILDRTELGLRLADEGDDVGRLVPVTDDARTDLVHAVVTRDDGEPSDQVRHALALFRERGADRHQKRSAVAALHLVLEERRYTAVDAAMAKKDSGAIFEIANGFHIRHQDAKQRRDYDDFYLDWIFWVYLASIELTNRVIDQQNR